MKKIRHGLGIYKHDGNEYEGEFADDKMHGHGEQGRFRIHACLQGFFGGAKLMGQTVSVSRA